MGKDNEEFRDELTKLANIVEIIENSFIGNELTEIEIKVSEDKINYLINNLKSKKENKVIINIENTNFIFSKK